MKRNEGGSFVLTLMLSLFSIWVLVGLMNSAPKSKVEVKFEQAE